MIEFTLNSRVKVGLKKMLSLAFDLLGGFYIVRRCVQPAISVVVYHRVVEDHADGVIPYTAVRKGRLISQIRFFKKHYAVIPLSQAVERLKNNRVDRHYLAITFDDGYRDNYSIGFDIFRDEGVTPTIFVTTGCVEQGEPLWPDVIRQLVYAANTDRPIELENPKVSIARQPSDRIGAVKALIDYLKGMDLTHRAAYIVSLQERLGKQAPNNRLMLNWSEIEELDGHGVEFGSHTVHHPILSAISLEALRAELRDSKRALEERLKKPVKVFAYPNGSVSDFDEYAMEELKKARYEAALTTIRGVNRNGCDPFQLRRTGIYITDDLNDVRMKMALESILSA